MVRVVNLLSTFLADCPAVPDAPTTGFHAFPKWRDSGGGFLFPVGAFGAPNSSLYCGV